MNKLLILIAVFLLTIQFSNAQTEKGNQTLGFNFGFNTGKATEIPGPQSASLGSTFVEKNNYFSLGPNYSYFIANNLDLSVALDFMSNKETNSDNNFGYPLKYTNYQFDAMLYARKYFLYKNKFGIRTGPYIGYGKSTTKYTYTPSDNNNNNSHNIYAGFKLDMVYYASKKLGFSATLANLQYQRYTSKSGYLGQDGNGISLYTGTSALQVSMFYTFGGKG
ncbi:hypothetical protein [uncultured Mucilaginibacter sp.]|uniref:hypothetical protein n=1 Tax=uncultured Mucilaginibacter sp. TaxID=797541 RepID=UPI0025D4A253|nr:hypothetical protein [uncultured Mucilaginibacter sp.]